MDYQYLQKSLEIHEDRRNKPYLDTEGHVTIGIGRNLDAKGVNDKIIDIMLREDVDDAIDDAMKFPWFRSMFDNVRQNVIVEMLFNLGLAKFKTFKKMIAALENKNYRLAAHEMLDSKWADQVGERANRLALMMRTGEWPDEKEFKP